MDNGWIPIIYNRYLDLFLLSKPLSGFSLFFHHLPRALSGWRLFWLQLLLAVDSGNIPDALPEYVLFVLPKVLLEYILFVRHLPRALSGCSLLSLLLLAVGGGGTRWEAMTGMFSSLLSWLLASVSSSSSSGGVSGSGEGVPERLLAPDTTDSFPAKCEPE